MAAGLTNSYMHRTQVHGVRKAAAVAGNLHTPATFWEAEQKGIIEAAGRMQRHSSCYDQNQQSLLHHDAERILPAISHERVFIKQNAHQKDTMILACREPHSRRAAIERAPLSKIPEVRLAREGRPLNDIQRPKCNNEWCENSGKWPPSCRPKHGLYGSVAGRLPEDTVIPGTPVPQS